MLNLSYLYLSYMKRVSGLMMPNTGIKIEAKLLLGIQKAIKR